MKTEKLFHILYSVFLIMIVNTMVNFSENLFYGLRHPIVYFFIVMAGLIMSIYIQLTGAYVILDRINRRINDRTNLNN